VCTKINFRCAYALASLWEWQVEEDDDESWGSEDDFVNDDSAIDALQVPPQYGPNIKTEPHMDELHAIVKRQRRETEKADADQLQQLLHPSKKATAAPVYKVTSLDWKPGMPLSFGIFSWLRVW
jgi:hypothetical protein